MWTALAALAAAVIGGIVTYAGTKKTNEVSKQISDENIAFQQEENAITRIREDTAHQRAASDLQAAGLSKTLAAGNPASAQSLTAPQANYSYENPLQKTMEKMNLKQAILDIESHQKDIQKQNAEIDSIKANTAATNLSNEVFMQRFTDEHNLNEAQVEVARTNVKLMESQERLNQISGDYKAREIEAQISNLMADTSYKNVSTSKASKEISKIVAETQKLSKEEEMLVEDIAYQKLKNYALSHDIAYAETTGLPVGSMPSGLLGSGLSTGMTLKNLVRNKLGLGNSFTFTPQIETFVNPFTGEQVNFSSEPYGLGAGHAW